MWSTNPGSNNLFLNSWKLISFVDEPWGKDDNIRPRKSRGARSSWNFFTTSSWKFHLSFELESFLESDLSLPSPVGFSCFSFG
uniref:Uncharacterized protein n=1 Tax=Arundo donax TaxID=35708 RepID=A0A0A9G4Y6_ARUDO